MVSDSGITFNVIACTGSTNVTGTSSGQIPEVYYIAWINIVIIHDNITVF